jgi:hypothetical protein
MQRRKMQALLASSLAVASITVSAAPVTSSADPPVSRDASVIVRWNEITERTLAENAVPIPPSGLYYAFTSLAMYDAVMAIEGRYEPLTPQPRAHRHASPEAAAATAAYLVLSHYYPASRQALTADYKASLADIDNGVGKVHGIKVGAIAALKMILSRRNDGRDANVPQPGGPPLDAGEWRPTAPAFAPMLTPWLGFVTPVVLPSPTAIPMDGPPTLDSATYAAEFAEVRDFGGTVSMRSAEQTATALFWVPNAVRQYHIAMRDQVTERGLDIVDAARTLAVLDVSIADAAIACWRAKYDDKFWRPDTAIALADTDGNPATNVVVGWTPLIPNPPYPDYTSGHACITGATTGTLEHLFGSALNPAFDVPSLAATPSRRYTSTTSLDEETKNARIWLGIHFRTAMTDGNALGHAVADTVAAAFHATD